MFFNGLYASCILNSPLDYSINITSNNKELYQYCLLKYLYDLWRPQSRFGRRSVHDLFYDIFQYDQGTCTDDINNDILRQGYLDTAGRDDNCGSFLCCRRVLGMKQLFTQIIGLEIFPVFPVPLPTLPTMMFLSAIGIFAGLLPADLPRVGHKPFAANPARPLRCTCSLHRALSYRWIDGTIL